MTGPAGHGAMSFKADGWKLEDRPARTTGPGFAEAHLSMNEDVRNLVRGQVRSYNGHGARQRERFSGRRDSRRRA